MILVADPPFRRSDYKERIVDDNKNKILLKTEYFKIRSINAQHHTLISDNKLIEKVKLVLLQDDYT